MSESSAEKSYREKFVDWITTSTSHGIPNIFRTKNYIIKGIWVIAVLASISYCSYFIITSVINFLQYQTTINTQLLREVPSVFPAVTICNLNPLDYENNREYFNSLFHQNDLEFALSIFDTNFESFYVTEEQIATMEDFTNVLKRLVALDPSLNQTERSKLGFSLRNDMLLSCKFNNKPCTADDFYQSWNDDYGNCYTFNSIYLNGSTDSLLKTSRAGPNYGLELELLVGNPAVNRQYSNVKGIYMIIHNNSVSPFLSSNGIHVPCGSASYITFTRTFTQKLSNPYSNCLTEMKPFSDYSRKLFGYMERFNVTQYNSEFCYRLCYQDKLIKDCKCADLTVPRFSSATVCNSESELSCLSRIQDLFSSSDIEKLCNYACPIECNSLSYVMLDHKATFPTDYYYNQIMIRATIDKDESKNTPYQIISDSYQTLIQNRLDSLAFLRDNVVKVTVNYGDLRYTFIQETPQITIDTLFGVLGGQLGLFIGVSLLSFLEVIELLFQFSAIWFRKSVEKSNGDGRVGQILMSFKKK